MAGRALTMLTVSHGGFFFHKVSPDSGIYQRFCKISGSPVAGMIFRYSTGKSGRVGKYAILFSPFLLQPVESLYTWVSHRHLCVLGSRNAFQHPWQQATAVSVAFAPA